MSLANLKRYEVVTCFESNICKPMFAQADGEWVKFADIEEILQTANQHTQPTKCLGCRYWQGIHGNICIRGDSEESCIKVGTQHAGA